MGTTDILLLAILIMASGGFWWGGWKYRKMKNDLSADAKRLIEAILGILMLTWMLVLGPVIRTLNHLSGF